MKRFLALLPHLCLLCSILLAGEIEAQQSPANAELNVYGNGWTCKRGYRLSDGKCIAVQFPANAELNVYGNGWTCKRGYRLSGGNCIAVQLPENAELNVYGNGWTCKRGYRLSDAKCIAVQLPENAELNVYGNGWACQFGFKRVGDACQKMNAAEAEAFRQLILQSLANRRGSFHSYPCTVDCSGHEAGYEWAEENGVSDPGECDGNSNSFIEGCEAYAEEQQDEIEQDESDAGGDE